MQSKIKRFFILTFILLFLISSISVSILGENEPINVLILYSNHYSQEWTNQLHTGITDSLNADNISIFPEYLNEFQLSKLTDYANIYDSLANKYKGLKLDCIVVVDNYAYNFLAEYYNEFSPDTPVVFVAVNGFDENMKFTSNMTGIPQNPNMEDFIKLVTSLIDENNELVFLSSNNATSVAERNSFESIINEKFNSINYRYLVCDTLEELLLKLKTIKNAKLIMIGNIPTEDGNVLSPETLISTIYNATQLPIFTLNRLHISTGSQTAVGGFVTDPYEHGVQAGKLALRIIDGEKASSIAINTYSPSSYVFNYNMLEKFGIDENELPEGSTIIDKPSKSIILSWRVAVSGIALIVFLVVLAIVLIAMIYMKIKDHKKITKTVEELSEKNKILEEEKEKISKKENENVMLLSRLREQQKQDSISTLAGGVAHEINNPLNGIMNYGQIIMEQSDSNSDNYKFAKEIVFESTRVAKIVSNLLQMTRHSKSTYKTEDIRSVILKTVTLINTVYKTDQIQLIVEIEEDLPLVKCNSNQIQQIILNLMTNARDSLNEKYKNFDDRKKVLLNCSLLKRSDGVWISIIIKDYGIGISESTLTTIFDPFFTTKIETKGTGLGLSISHNIIEEHKGKILVESKEGEYAEFTILLPVGG